MMFILSSSVELLAWSFSAQLTNGTIGIQVWAGGGVKTPTT
jgi:hypothetical protein